MCPGMVGEPVCVTGPGRYRLFQNKFVKVVMSHSFSRRGEMRLNGSIGFVLSVEFLRMVTSTMP